MMKNMIDYKKSLKQLYNPGKGTFGFVQVPAMNYLMVDGCGDPSVSIDYQKAVEALYNLAYKIKFTLKSPDFDYVVSPLEGLWWMDDMHEFTTANKYRWKWTMMIMQPDQLTDTIFENIKIELFKTKKNPQIDKARLEMYDEGLAVQILHIGAYTDEAPLIAKMHQFIQENGYLTNGKHHEIYLGDPRKTSPEKLRTILRQPVQKPE